MKKILSRHGATPSECMDKLYFVEAINDFQTKIYKNQPWKHVESTNATLRLVKHFQRMRRFPESNKNGVDITTGIRLFTAYKPWVRVIVDMFARGTNSMDDDNFSCNGDCDIICSAYIKSTIGQGK